jgi:hypothetical protein
VLHCMDDQVLPPEEANINFSRAWASGRGAEEGTVSVASAKSTNADQTDQRQREEAGGGPGCKGKVAEEATHVATIGERQVIKRKVLFEVGGHGYIWPMNWPIYEREVAALLAHCGHKTEEDFDPTGHTTTAAATTHKQRSRTRERCVLA